MSISSSTQSDPSHESTASPSIARIDLSALGHNLDQVRRRIPTGCNILAVVKADAYGHGALPIAGELARLGINRFGVATVQEGLHLRNAGLAGSILILGALQPQHIEAVAQHRLTPIIHDGLMAEQLAKLIPSRARPYPVHIKVDTGMSRLGLAPDDVLPLLQSSSFRETLAPEGLMTHLADADGEEPTFTTHQMKRFYALIAAIESAGITIPLIHAANSAGILRHPSTHFTLVRPGIMLYGYHTTTQPDNLPDLKPVLSLTTRVVQVRRLDPGQSVSYNRVFTVSRPSTIAVLPIGYGDGYSRHLSNRGAVLIKGKRAAIVGRICMDMTMVDVTDIPDVGTGDEAVMIGQQGGLRITAAHLATWAETIPYEILCAIGPRVRRVYR